jgi:BRCA1/BRCA2-containing complex subunit 3
MDTQSLSFVQITRDVYFACVSHALTTEKEEIMGLLIGNIEIVGDKKIAKVWDINMLTRVDKRKDRVEISSEQLVNATMEAEKLTKQGITTRVIGWYHSHPKISPWPSHVDLNCQGNYQQMEPGFIGLIFSVFNEESDNVFTPDLLIF